MGGEGSGEEREKGKNSGSALENLSESSMTPWVVGTSQVTRPFAPALTATMNSTMYNGVDDQTVSKSAIMTWSASNAIANGTTINILLRSESLRNMTEAMVSVPAKHLEPGCVLFQAVADAIEFADAIVASTVWCRPSLLSR